MKNIIRPYRAKREDNGEWVEGFLIGRYDPLQKENVVKSAWIDNGTCFESPCKVVLDTIGQFTGVYDCKPTAKYPNGQPIFEGDIVTIISRGYIPDVKRGVVVFREGSYHIEYYSKLYHDKRLHRIGQTDSWSDMGASGTITYTYEVLGNIYDNSNLLEEIRYE